MASLVNFRSLGVAAAIAVAVAVRVRYFPHQSWDYRTWLSVWYDTLATEGFSAFSRRFFEYAPSYLYLIYGATKLSFLSKIAGIKVINVVFDGVMAVFAFHLIRQRRRAIWAWLGAFAVLFSPVVVMIGSHWGQCDSVYTAFLLGFLAAASRQRWALSAALFGLALSVKLQSLFLAPVVLAFLLKGHFRWKHLALIPLMYAATNVPALLAGRSIGSLLTVYPAQARLYRWLSMDAPNIYQWIHGLPYDWGVRAGVLVGGAAAVALGVTASRRLMLLRSTDIVLLALASAVVVPFFLPKMHERYFYPAAVLGVIHAFIAPRHSWIAVVLQVATYYSCYHWLVRPKIPLPALAVGVFACLIALVILVRRGTVAPWPGPNAPRAS